MTAEDTLTARVQEDIVWRIRELTELIRACNEATSVRQEALLRAAVPVMYAHWEGYFVYAANAYLNFVAEKGILISSLKDQFWALTVKRKYRYNQLNSEKSFSRFLLEVKGLSDRNFKKGIFERINGQSNLNSEVLEFCCSGICIDITPYRCMYDFIDKDLIDRRNHIAHGSSLKFPASQISDWRDKVVELMRLTQTQIENAAITGSYRR